MYCKKRKKWALLIILAASIRVPQSKDELFSHVHILCLFFKTLISRTLDVIVAGVRMSRHEQHWWSLWTAVGVSERGKRIHPLSVQRCRFITWVDKVYTLLQAYITSHQDKMEYWPEWFVIVFALLWNYCIHNMVARPNK